MALFGKTELHNDSGKEAGCARWALVEMSYERRDFTKKRLVPI